MEELTFYFDRCFGKSLPEAIRRAKPPFNVEYQHDPKGTYKFKQNTPDDVWLSLAGANKWIVFSHDRKFHTVSAECEAVKQFNIGCFYLWGSNALSWEKLRCFMRAHDRMLDAISKTPRPFIFDVAQSGRLKRVQIPI